MDMRKASYTRLIKKTTLEPRPYQERIINRAVVGFFEHGMNSILVESATGSGKTSMALVICKLLQGLVPDLKIGWFAGRRNLLAQAERENTARKIGANIDFVSMFDKNPPTDLDMIVCDEAQHDATETMMHIHALNKPRWILGMTATPFRTDHVKLCFDTVIKDAGISRLIKDGYLSQYHHYTVPEWSPKHVTDLYIKEPERWGKSLMFFHTLAQCDEALARLKRAKARVELVTGSTDRETQLAKFERNEIDVIVNCMVLTEGFDCPSLQTVFARDSCKSVTIQMCGRAFRKHADTPIKQIVQSRRTKWPFVKTAMPAIQLIQAENGDWRSLTINPQIAAINQKMLRIVARTNVELPAFFKNVKPVRRRPDFGNERVNGTNNQTFTID